MMKEGRVVANIVNSGRSNRAAVIGNKTAGPQPDDTDRATLAYK